MAAGLSPTGQTPAGGAAPYAQYAPTQLLYNLTGGAALGWYNVKSVTYGAQGDGSTDDSGAIATAIAAAVAAGGGIVYFPSGTYVLTAKHLTLGNNVTLLGEGPANTILQLGSASIGGIIYDGGAWSNITIKGLTFDVNFKTSSNAIQLYSSSGVQNIHVFDCTIKNTNGGWGVVIGSTNTFGTGVSTGTWIERCTFGPGDTSTLEMVILANNTDCKIIGNRFYNRTASASVALSLYGYCYNVLVQGNTFVGNQQGDVSVTQGQHIAIIGNTFRMSATAEVAITLINCADILIANNDISGTEYLGSVYIYDYYGATFDGTHASVYPNTLRVTMAGNKISGTYTGITVGQQTDSTKNLAQQDIDVIGNTFSGITFACLYVAGANTGGEPGTGFTGNNINFANNVIDGGLAWGSGGGMCWFDVATTASGFFVNNNRCNGNGTTYGVFVSRTTDCHIQLNDFGTSGVGSPVSLNNGALAKVIRANVGFNPIGSLSAPTVPASGTPYINATGYDCQVIVFAGLSAVTGIALGGVGTGITAALGSQSPPFRVPAGQSITLTYTSAPTWNWFGD